MLTVYFESRAFGSCHLSKKVKATTKIQYGHCYSENYHQT